eukprot:GHRR01029211.1.p2 GENE.GHRR01029211.1~~GHRR01029211.1.p2  ORF type:complete len:108 (-),score=24.41 GHRR01029211.1:569-892(-)
MPLQNYRHRATCCLEVWMTITKQHFQLVQVLFCRACLNRASSIAANGPRLAVQPIACAICYVLLIQLAKLYDCCGVQEILKAGANEKGEWYLPLDPEQVRFFASPQT